MAIQISEKKLSPEAVKVLNNVKSKSQFLRDAIEYYVKSTNEINQLAEIKGDIKEIKEVLSEILNERSMLKEIFNTISDQKLEFKSNNDIKNEVKENVEKPLEKERVKSDKENLLEKEKREIEMMLDNSIEKFI